LNTSGFLFLKSLNPKIARNSFLVTGMKMVGRAVLCSPHLGTEILKGSRIIPRHNSARAE
jgi:hypothetical protein